MAEPRCSGCWSRMRLSLMVELKGIGTFCSKECASGYTDKDLWADDDDEEISDVR